MNISEMVRTVLLEDIVEDLKNDSHSDVSGMDDNTQRARRKDDRSRAQARKYGPSVLGGATILGGVAALAKDRMTKTPETTKIVAKSFKDSVKDRVMEHPKAAMAAAGAASALGAGYGAYKYLKNRKGKKK